VTEVIGGSRNVAQGICSVYDQVEHAGTEPRGEGIVIGPSDRVKDKFGGRDAKFLAITPSAFEHFARTVGSV